MNAFQFSILIANAWILAAFFLSGSDALMAAGIGLLWLLSACQENRLQKLKEKQ